MGDKAGIGGQAAEPSAVANALSPSHSSAETIDPSFVEFGRDICGDLQTASQREWLVTNGIGGFGSGTVGGALTRHYQGLLIAALNPPLGRTLLVSKVEEIAAYEGQNYPLATNVWAGGAIDPQGYRYIERFRLEGAIPVWTFACGSALVEKRMWMARDANTTYITYSLTRSITSLRLTLKVLVNYCDFHSTTHAGDWRMDVSPVENGFRVSAFDGATPFNLLSASARAEPAHAQPAHDWYRNFDLPAERERGLDDHADHLLAGTFRATLEPGESVTLVFSTDSATNLDGGRALDARIREERSLLDRWETAQPRSHKEAPPWVRQLVLAANPFIVRRPLADGA